MTLPDLPTFRDRLLWVLGDRKLTPWALSLGLTKGMVSRISDGHVPRSNVLGRIAWIEGVSLNWLLNGAGAPFHVAVTNTIDDAVAAALGFIDEEPWSAHVLDARGKDQALVLTLPAELRDEGATIEYVAVESIVGPPDMDWAALARGAQGGYWEVPVSPDAIARLRAGAVGPYELTGGSAAGEAGLLAQRREPRLADDRQDRALRLAEPGQEYPFEDDPLGHAYELAASQNPASARRRLLELLERSLQDLEAKVRQDD